MENFKCTGTYSKYYFVDLLVRMRASKQIYTSYALVRVPSSTDAHMHSQYAMNTEIKFSCSSPYSFNFQYWCEDLRFSVVSRYS